MIVEDNVLNMRLFADRVLPVIQHDTAFKGTVNIPGLEGKQEADVFAPA